ncbi:hypothetical protein [Mycolicibacterium neoaurum]|uniref:hypothetical protein n=1 Tax=Mycolicibacterium neoaurum TaxID=1795 RepID=UPI000ACC5D68|nr:hypothetical protein [Mycolicibacterium neoaurum]
MTSAEQRDRDLLDRVTNVLEGVSPPPWSFYMDDEWDAAVFVDRTPDAHEPTQNDTYLFLCPDCGTRGGATVHDAQFVAAARQLVPELAAELSRLRAQETRIRALCVESENEKWMREISRDATGRPICQHTVLAADILAVLDTEEGQA